MKTLLAKLLVFLIIFQIISPISIIGQVFAVSNIWDFIDYNNYTFSKADKNYITVENSNARLPLHLEHISSISDTKLDGASKIIIKGDYAFVSAFDNDSISSIDISNPANPIILDTIKNGDSGINMDGPIGLAYSGSYLYVAGYNSDNINIFNISDLNNISFVKEIADDNMKQQLDGVKDLQVSGDYLYATSYTDDAFNIFDISDPANPDYLKNLKDNTKLNGIGRFKVDSGYAYVVAEENNSFEIIDLSNQDSQMQTISIVGEVKDGDNGALLDTPKDIIFSGSLAYIASSTSNAMEIIDINDKTNPSHTGAISGGDTKLNANSSIALYNNFALNGAYTDDAIEIVDVSDNNNPKHESYILKTSDIKLDGVSDLSLFGDFVFAVSNIDDSLEVLKIKYDNTNPYVISKNYYSYTGAINSFSENLGVNSQGTTTYQISRDNGNTWYYLNGNSWEQTSSGVENSNTALEINNNLINFNLDNRNGTGSFIFKAFLNSDSTQKVDLDKVSITTIESPDEISNPVFWYDGADTDGDGDSSNEPSSGDELETWIDKFNSYNASNTEDGQVPQYNTDGAPNIYFDGDDYYKIGNQDDINTGEYYEKSFALIFQTGDDITTFQNIYEQGGNARGYTFQIENGHLYTGVFNNVEWDDDDQYKFVDLGEIDKNQIYYLMMIQDSTNTKTLKVYLDSNLFETLDNVEYQRAHAGAIGLGYINGNIVKASDNSVEDEPSYFKGHIGEFISWNHALSPNEKNGVDMYIKNKWGIDFRIFPLITNNTIDGQIFLDGNFDFEINYQDGLHGPGIDINSIDLNLYKFNPSDSSWKENTIGNITANSITTSTGSFSASGLTMGDYKLDFGIANNNGTYIYKDFFFSIDPIGSPDKVFHYDAQNLDGDFDSSNEPNSGDNISKIVDLKNAYNANQSDSSLQAIYETGGINRHASINFDGNDDYYKIDNEDDINLDNYYEKSYSMVLKTGDDIDNLQVIYEQGGGYRGYGIQIENSHMYIGVWNNHEWDDGHEYKFIDLGEIETNRIYNILFTQDSTSGADDTDIVKGYINGQLAGTLDHVDYQRGHGGDIVFGKNHDGRKYNGDDIGDGYYFKGEVGEYISWNHALTDEEINNLNNYLKDRWDLDNIAPVISGTNFASGSLLPGGNHNFEFNYSDTSEYGTGVGIDINSGNIILEKWDSGNSAWEDVLNKIGTGTLTENKASYPSLNLDYGKYKMKFSISDNNGNISDVFENIFYIDRPSLVVSTGTVNIGTLNDSTNTFGDTLTITVKTIGTPFRVKLKKNKILTQVDSGDIIPYYDGSLGIGYDKNDDGNLSDFNDDIILSDSGNLNIDGELNTYTYTLKMGAIINKLQASGNYEGKIDFQIELDY